MFSSKSMNRHQLGWSLDILDTLRSDKHTILCVDYEDLFFV